MIRKLTRSQATAALVALLVLLAGCSALGGPSAESPTDTAEPTETESNTTASMTETDAASDQRSAALSGRMLVVIDGSDTHLNASQNSSFWFNESNEHTWHAEESMTLAEALEQTGVEADADSLAYDGETYRESDENTTITYRVAGTEIADPSEYELEALNPAHEIVVRVDSGEARETPGQYFDQSHPHPHGQLNVTVDGESVNFTQEKYTMASESFHFHGDENASRWHAHSLNLTVAHAVSTFPGMNMTADSLTYDGTTYRANGTEASFTVTVNGEPVDPETYVLKDGDAVQVSVEETL